MLTNSLEAARHRAALPEAELLLIDELGLPRADRGRACRARRRARARRPRARALGRRRRGRRRPTSPSRSPTGCARRAIALTVDGDAVDAPAPRRSRAAELAGIRRAQRAAEAGMAAAERLIRGADRARRAARAGGEPLTAERVRAAIRAACAAAGAPAPPGIMVVSRAVGRRPRPGLRPAARRPADRRRPLAARRGERLLGRHDADVRRRHGQRRGRDAARRRARGARGGARRRAPGHHRPRALRHRGGRRRARRPPHAAHAHARASRSPTASTSASATASAWRCTSRPGSASPAATPLVAGDVIAIEPGIEGLRGHRRRALRGPAADHRRRLRDAHRFPYEL